MTTLPRFSHKEVRQFANELARDGWEYTGDDTKGHSTWHHPQASGPYKLPETPRHFDLTRARQDVARLLGRKVRGKRRPKPASPARATQADLAAAKREADHRAAVANRARRAASIRASAESYRREQAIKYLMRPGC